MNTVEVPLTRSCYVDNVWRKKGETVTVTRTVATLIANRGNADAKKVAKALETAQMPAVAAAKSKA